MPLPPGPFRFRSAARSARFQVLLGTLILLFCVTLGTAGYLLLEEGWTVLDAFYMTIITITTVGYREVHPLSPAGQLFTSFLVVAGLGALLYTLTRVAQVVFEGELLDVLGRRSMEKEITALDRHFIVCGFGKVGRPVAEGLAREKLPFCVVEVNPEAEPTLREAGFVHIIGDATEEAVLVHAGIRRAQTLLALLPSDADNLYLTIVAKDLKPGIKVIARAVDQAGEVRIKRGGADEVISPTRIAGLRVLQAAVNPSALEFMEIVTRNQAMQLSMADIAVSQSSALCGQSIAECGVRGRYGVIIVAIKRPEGMEFNPDVARVIRSGDVLVVLGEDMDIAQLQADTG